jgi:predicted 2-oxoglutarate/Fe(II)-dependent dioxygenase YbiX
LGEPVIPTYTYARVCKNGSILERHRDREACEISITLHLSGDNKWPIHIQKPNGEEVELVLESGEAMMYLGCSADHWRNQFQGQEYVQVFLHYVRSRGENAWAAFDKIREKPEDFVSIEEKDRLKYVKNLTYSKNLDDYIVEFENIIPPELCDEILREYENCSEWGPTYVGGGIIDRNTRNVETICVSMANVISRNEVVRKRLDDLIFQSAALAIKKYNEMFPEAHIEQDSGYELLRYKEGFFYKQHTDSFKAQPRSVSCSFALNDDFEGGGFAFFNNEYQHKLKKGSVLMFPSNFMYPHEVLPITKGTRYSIVTWFI